MELTFDGLEKNEKVLNLRYINKKEELFVTTELEFFSGTNVISQKNTVKNIGTQKVLLTKFSSSFIENIGYSEECPWYEKDLEAYI